MVAELTSHPQVEALLREFRPESISIHRNEGDVPGETVVLGQPVRKGPEASSPPPPAPGTAPEAWREAVPADPPRAAAPLAASPAPPQPGPAAVPPAPAAPPPPDRAGALRSEWLQRAMLAVLTATGMSVAISLLAERGGAHTFFGGFLIIISGAAAVLVAERRPAAGTFSFEPGVPRRILTLAIASPLYLAFSAFGTARQGYRGTVIALILATLVIDWGQRARRDRALGVGIQHAFRAGLVGLIASCIFTPDNLALVTGALAAVSLVVNVQSPWEPRGRPGSGPGRARFPAAAPGPAGRPGYSAAARGLTAASAALAAAARGVAAIAPVPPASSGSRSGRRPLGPLGRALWLGFSAIALAGSIATFIGSGFELRGEEQMAGFYAAAVQAVLFAVTFRLGSRVHRPGLWGVIRGTALLSLLGAAGFCAMLLAGFRMHGDERIVTITVLVFCLVFAFFLGLLPGRLAQPRAPEVERPPVSPGWGSLGSLLVTLAVIVVLGSALLASGAGGPLLDRMGPLALEVRKFVQTGSHLLVGCALFLPGIFCVLRARQVGGAAHVLRGGLGFTGAGLLIYTLSQLIPTVIPADRAIEFSPVAVKSLFALFALGVLSALLLFWPAKALHAGMG